MNCSSKQYPECWYGCPDKHNCEDMTTKERTRLMNDDKFKAGIKEVVDWITNNHGHCIATMEYLAISEYQWKQQLKDWGIE